MTKDEILAMEPGLEMDAVVAEKVIGHKLGWLTDYGFKKEYERRVIALPGRRYDNIPRYSTNITAAWEVVEKFFIEIIPQSGAPKGYNYLARIIDRPRLAEDIEVFGDSAPEAICKAALLAILT